MKTEEDKVNSGDSRMTELYARVETVSVHGLGRISAVIVAQDGTIFACTDSAVYSLAEGPPLEATACTRGAVVPTRIAGHVTDEGCRDGAVSEARFRGLRGIAIDGRGDLVLCDAGNHCIRKVKRSAVAGVPLVTTIAGCADVQGFVDGVGNAARFDRPGGIALDPTDGVLLVTDTNNHALRVIVPDSDDWEKCRVLTLTGGVRGFRDGHLATALFNSPCGIALDGHGNAIVADVANHCIRKVLWKISPGLVTTVAGRGGAPGFCDGSKIALFNNPRDVAVDASGRVLVADASNHRVRMIGMSGDWAVTTLAGSGERGRIDGEGAVADFDRPWSMTLDPRGRLLVACFNTFGCLRVINSVFPWRLARLLYIGAVKGRGEGQPAEKRCLLALLPTEGSKGLVCPLLEKIVLHAAGGFGAA